MSAKSKRKKAGRSRQDPGGRKRTVARINYGGLKIKIPPELDLPAGAPFATRPQPEPAPNIPSDVQALLKPLAAIATNAWRAKIKMIDTETGEPLEEMRRAYRFVENIFTALGDAGVLILDQTGKAYDSGMQLKVLNFESTPGLSREEIIQTIRPSVVWQERLLQMGEVIVGTSETAEQHKTATDHEGGWPESPLGEEDGPVTETNDTSNNHSEGADDEQNND